MSHEIKIFEMDARAIQALSTMPAMLFSSDMSEFVSGTL